MTTKGLGEIIGKHKLFAGFRRDFLELIEGCAKNTRFKPNEHLCQEGAPANEIYLIRTGHVALEIAEAGRGRITFQTAGPGEVLGLSWLVPPYRWTYDARAIDDTRAISIDAACLRNKCEMDSVLGYEVMKRFMPTIVERLHATRLQLLDLYGTRKPT